MATRKSAKKPAKKPAAKKPAAKKPAAKKPAAKAAAPVAATLKYALTSLRTMLGDGTEHGVVEERDGVFTATWFGVGWAEARIDGNDLVTTFLCPDDIDDLEGALKFYELADRPGWLVFRRPISRDPRPALEASFGPFLGRVKAQIRRAATADRWHAIASTGPFIALDQKAAYEWWGKDESPDEYAAISVDRGPVRAVPVLQTTALTIHSPKEATWVPSPEGGTIVQILATKHAKTEDVRPLLTRLPTDGWSVVAADLAVDKRLVCFDAASSGSSVDDDHKLRLEIGTGTFRVDTRTWSPEPGTDLALFRFTRTSAPPAASKSLEERMRALAPKPPAGAKRLLGSITSNGGPFIVLPEVLASAWQGFDDEPTYDTFGKKAPEAGGIVKIGKHEFLGLGTPDNLYFAPNKDGGLFVRVVGFDGDDDALADALAKLPARGWKSAATWKIATSPLLAFDSASPGAEARGDALEIAIEPGSYAIDSLTFEPSAGGELLLTRLRRA